MSDIKITTNIFIFTELTQSQKLNLSFSFSGMDKLNKVIIELIDLIQNRIFHPQFSLPVQKKKQLTVKPLETIYPAEKWKAFPSASEGADFSYTKPKVDIEKLSLTKQEKVAIERKSKKQCKKSMCAMESSIVDASTKHIKNHPEIMATVDKFSRRCLDIYEAYTETMIDNGEPLFSLDVGQLKKYGYSHKQIKNFQLAAKKYLSLKTNFKEAMEKEIKNLNGQLSEEIASHIAENNFDPKKSGIKRSCLSKEAAKHLKNRKVMSLIQDYCSHMKEDKHLFETLKTLEGKSIRFGATRQELEKIKEDLAQFDPNRNDAFGLKNDKRHRLLQEIRQRCYGGDDEPGSVGSPLRLLNVLEGKKDQEDPEALYRLKLYFAYKSKSIINEVLADPKLMAQVNHKLKEQKDWSLEEDIIEALRAESPENPIFKFGKYSAENWKGKLRNRVPAVQSKARKYKDPNLTFAESDTLASQRDLGSDIDKVELSNRFRYKISEEEKMAFLGTNSEIDRREHAPLLESANRVHTTSHATLPLHPKKTADTGYYESPLEYKMRTTELPWDSGKHYWDFYGKPKCSSPYLDSVEELGLPQLAGISGSTDQMFTMAGALGITSQEELQRLRLAFLPWMVGADDHSVNEIMTSAKSFGLPYTPSADYYKQVLPGDSEFIENVKAAQKARGHELPEYYLSQEYAEKVLEELQTGQLSEAKQEERVNKLQMNHKILMKSLVASKMKGNLDDLFCDGSWDWFLKKFDNPRKPSKKSMEAERSGKIKYVYNPGSDRFEPHKKNNTYQGTKKTEVSLLPSHGKINPYGFDQDGKDVVGLLFNADASEYKDQYVFESDALTCNKWWRRFYSTNEMKAKDFQKRLDQDLQKLKAKEGKGSEESRNHLRAGSMQKLIKKLEKSEKHDEFMDYNEILASVKEEGLAGIFCYIGDSKEHSKQNAYTRFHALSKKLYLREKLGVNLPVFIIDRSNNQGMKIYTAEQQAADIQNVLKNQNGELNELTRTLSTKLDSTEEEVIRKQLSSKLHSMLAAL